MPWLKMGGGGKYSQTLGLNAWKKESIYIGSGERIRLGLGKKGYAILRSYFHSKDELIKFFPIILNHPAHREKRGIIVDAPLQNKKYFKPYKIKEWFF